MKKFAGLLYLKFIQKAYNWLAKILYNIFMIKTTLFPGLTINWIKTNLGKVGVETFRPPKRQGWSDCAE